jgi:hypothetical protein
VTTMKITIRTWFAVTATALIASVSGAQTPPTPSLSDRDRAQTEMRELFAKVERRLREIDRLLSDAGAGDTAALSGEKKAGIEELLRTSETRQREVLQAIDRILELARDNQRQGAGGGSSQSGDPQSGSQSPLDKQGNPTTEREETPSAPKGSQSPKDGEKPGPKNKAGAQPKPDKPEPGESDPRDPRASPNKNSKNSPGAPPSGQPTDAASKADGKDRWGDLPVKVRDVFRTEGGSDMPVQYREWIDSYYRRLNKKR